MKKTNWHFRLLAFSALMLLAISCEKQTDQVDHEQKRFIKLYTNTNSALLSGISENSDGSFFVGKVGLVDKTVVILHAEKSGELLGTQEVELNKNEEFIPSSTKLKTGETVFTNRIGSHFIKLDVNGNITVNKKWSAQVRTALVNKPFLEDSGNLLFGVSEYNTGGTRVGVFRVDPDGNLLDVFNVDLGGFNKAIFSLSVAKAENGKMLLVGDCKPEDYKYSDKAKIFVAELDEATQQVSKVMIIDEFDDSESDFYIGVAPSDNGFVILSGGTLFASFPGAIPSKEFELFFIGDDLQLLDRRRYDVGAINSVPSDIVRLKDYGYLVSGYTSSINQRDYKGFMIKIDRTGKKEHSRIFPFLEHLELYEGIETQDGSFVFTGGSLSFGNGKEGMTPVLLKTDIRGNIE